MEQKSEVLFPRGNIFLDRMILSYLTPAEMLTTISNLNHSSHKLAYDCSLWQSVELCHSKFPNLSYDFEDFLAQLYSKLTRPQEMPKIDLHYSYRNQDLPRELLLSLQQFTNLRDLRFGQHIFENTQISLFQKLHLPLCTHLRLPLVGSETTAKDILNSVAHCFPNLESLHFEDINTQNSSFTEKLSAHVHNLFPNLKALTFRLHEESTVGTTANIRSLIFPKLEKLHMKSLNLQTEEHRELLKLLLKKNQNLKELNLANQSTIQPIEFNFDIYSLRKLKLDRVTSHYESLTAWCERNSNLQSIKIKFPWMSVDPYEAGPFNLSSLSDLQILNIQGLFSKINLVNLPSLKQLKIKHRDSKIKLRAFPKAVLCLFMLSAQIHSEDQITITNFDLEFFSVKRFDLINGQICHTQPIPHLFSLQTNNFDLLPHYSSQNHLRCLNLIFPKYVTLPLQELFPKLAQIRFLSALTLDFKFCNQSSPGEVKFGLSQVTSLTLKEARLVDDPVQITEQATSLEHFEISYTDIKKVYIKAPHIRFVKLKFLKKYDDLVITAKNGYTLSLQASPVHIKRCPGIGKLILNANFGGHFTSEEMQPDFYEHLEIIQMKDLNKYSNEWFHTFRKTAPKLTSIFLQFYKFVGLENDHTDKVLHIMNPTIKWVTLLCGECIFQSILVDKKCINLKLLKFRDFELNSFTNQSTARISSEKNIVAGKDF